MSLIQHGGNSIEKLKFIDQDLNEVDNDTDNDSLASALSDYNNVFYDAPSIPLETKPVKKSNFMVEGSTDISFADKSDEDLYSLEDDDQFKQNKTLNEQESDEERINKEFEDYLNEEEFDYSGLDESKLNKINKLESIEYNFANYDLIKKLAIDKHGFVNKKFRRKAWPVLILYKKNKNLNDLFNSSLNKFKNINQKQIENNRYNHQITLDVVRTLKRFPPEISEKLRAKLQKELIDLICKILIKHDNLHYYQGYHDICLTFLLVTGSNGSLPLLENITLSHLTLFMETTMESTLKQLFNIMPLIDQLNSQVAEHIQKAELGVIFGLSWLITWYSHVMDNLKIILRLYDFFIATDPMMPIYLGAIIVSDKTDEILSIECDMASLHTVITKYPTKINDYEVIEDYIKSALELYESYPPKLLPELNEKWLKKCEKIQQQQAELRKALEEEENNLRQRRNKNSKNKNNASDTKLAKRKDFSLARLKESKLKGNKLLFGLTFTVGVAAVAMYALNNNVKDTPDLFSKFYHFLSLKEF